MRTIYVCEACGLQYDEACNAIACETSIPDPPIVQVGDIVTAGGAFLWYDGNRDWVVNPENEGVPTGNHNGAVRRAHECPNGDTNCFSPCCTMQFYYVVTHIDVYQHHTRYHLVTEAMTGREGYRAGFTYGNRHFTPVKVENPPESVIKTSIQLIGHKCGGLL